ncbi:MAG TPA: RNA polymerase factor sigma-54 [Candidatus Koribacter sp.]|jgi:RNA polymerase sigma-54 factor
MVLLQPRLNLKVSQKQILTPGLVQMVSVLALNKMELKEMINEEMIENPVLEELDENVPLIDDISAKEEQRDRDSSVATAEEAPATPEAKDPFEEIDFGSFFQEYLDPGYRSRSEIEDVERPSFENFLSKPTTLTDHLMWQLGSMHLKDDVLGAAELVIGNLNDEGYLTASEDELLGLAAEEPPEPPSDPLSEQHSPSVDDQIAALEMADVVSSLSGDEFAELETDTLPEAEGQVVVEVESAPQPPRPTLVPPRTAPPPVPFSRDALREAVHILQNLDPIGIAARDLRECLLIQLRYYESLPHKNGNGQMAQAIGDALHMVSDHMHELQNKQYKEIAKALGRPIEAVSAALDFVRTLDPKPGLRYNKQETRLIEPDVAFVKQGDEYIVVMNDEEIPQLRVNPGYKRLLHRDAAEKDVRNYVKERYKSAIQLIKNIEQRKQTILKVCYSIINRQRDFLDQGIDQLKPMMIKEVAEEIGVHPSTVSRAVANKYVHSSQGVYELRYFFSESVNGPEGGATSLLILKRRVKKLIEEEDPARPLTDEQITRILQSQGIQVTRRTVAKYREDMKIPSTHQRRVRS